MLIRFSLKLVLLLAPIAAHTESARLGSASSPPPAAATIRAQSVDERIAALEEKVRSLTADADDWVRLGDAMMQKSRGTLDSSDYGRAESAYRRALEMAPGNAQALIGLAWVHNTEHDFAAGDRFARAALEIDPGLPEPHALLGDAAVERGDYDTAFDHYQHALGLRPDLSSYSRAAHLLWLTGNPVRAQQLMRKAIAAGGSHPENTAWCRAQLALMSFHSGALIPAELEIERAVREAPDNHAVLAVAVTIKMAQEKYSDAIELCRRAVDQAPTHETLVALGDLYALTGQSQDAEEQYDRVVQWHTAAHHHTHDGITHSHAHPAGNAQLARFYADHDRELNRAVEEAEAAHKRFPNVFVADTLAWCYFKKGRYQEAEAAIREALKWKTPIADIHFHAGLIYAKLGNRPAAQKHLYFALSLNSHFHPVFARTAAEALASLGARQTPLAITTSELTR